jgi:tol-pal system protein YbgF
MKISGSKALMASTGLLLCLNAQESFSLDSSMTSTASQASQTAPLSTNVVPVPLTVSGVQAQQNQDSHHTQAYIQSLENQITQLKNTVDAVVQQESQQQNEMSLLQQRVLQLEAQNELAQSKLHQEMPPVAESSVSQNALSSSAAAGSSSSTTSSPNAIAVVADSPENAALYANAYGLINQGEYKKAELALNAYLQAEPKGMNAADAHYWLGEIHMVNAQSDVAAKEFRIVISEFPYSQKAPSAMRELGEIFLANGDSQHAKQTLQMVVKKYPDTAAAILAQKTLDTM